MQDQAAIDLYREICEAAPAIPRFFQLTADQFQGWYQLGEHLADTGLLPRIATEEIPMSKGQRMLCLTLVAKADYAHVAAQAEPNVWGPAGFWSMDPVNGRLALRVIAQGVWDQGA